jgi:hypothetical protein
MPDFTPQLDFAVQNAIEVQPGAIYEGVARPIEGSENNPAAVYAELSDDDLITLGDAGLYEPNVVYTFDREEYWQLLRQVFCLPLDGVGDEANERLAAAAYEHEIEHADIAAEVSPHADIAFAVRIFKEATPDGGWAFSMTPSVVPIGIMRKIDFALLVAGPVSHSAGHAEMIEAMGYTSRDEIAERHRVAREAAVRKAIQQGFLPGELGGRLYRLSKRSR